MTRAAKELIVVLMVGASALYILWGATATKAPPGGIGSVIHKTDWTAIGIGLGVLAAAALIGFLVKPKKA
jgi:hypothetical protein